MAVAGTYEKHQTCRTLYKKHDVNNIGDMVLFYFDVPPFGSNVHNLFCWNYVIRRL